MGALAAVGAGTYASFTAQTNNANNTFQTGTLTLSNKQQAAATCWSTGTAGGLGTFNNGNVNNCDVIVSVANQKPAVATTFSSTSITVATAGSITPSSVTLAVSCASTNVAASANGNGDLCAYLGLTIQQCTATVTTTNCGPGNSVAKCVYPVNALAACAANPSVGGGVIPTTGNISAAVAAGPYTLAAGSLPTTSYQISWNLPDSGVAGQENPVQGRIATWALAWTAVQ